MKSKFATLLIAIFIAIPMMQVAAAAQCGTVDSVVMAHVDNMGYAPRLGQGSQAAFDCAVAFDPHFYEARFPNTWQAANYWFVLYGQALGLALQPLPAPRS